MSWGPDGNRACNGLHVKPHDVPGWAQLLVVPLLRVGWFDALEHWVKSGVEGF